MSGASQPSFDTEDDDILLAPIKLKPRRKWMSVSDLVTEVERSMHCGTRLETGGGTYTNLRVEIDRVRHDNDAIMAEVDALTAARAKFVAKEHEISSATSQDNGKSFHHPELEVVLKEIREVDLKLASLRHQQLQNIRDVGAMKRTIARIEMREEVNTLVGEIERTLEMGEVVDEHGPKGKALLDLIHRLREKFDAVTQAVAMYREDIGEMVSKLSTTQADLRKIRDMSIDEADEARWTMVRYLQKSKRMLAQLSRLRDLQVLWVKEISIAQRARRKLKHRAEIHGLIAVGDEQKLVSKVEELCGATAKLKDTITAMEADLEASKQEGQDAIAKLRILKDVVTPETGELREKLIENIHESELRMERLAVLRGEKAQNVRFLSILRATLSDREKA